MRKVKSSTFAIAIIALLFLLCALMAILFFATFAMHNYDAIAEDFDRIVAEDRVAKSLFDANIRVGPSMHIRETIADAVEDDACMLSLGEAATLENVDFLVQPSRAVVRAPNAAASVDITIQNNSSQPLTIPIDGGWTALCHRGNKLTYTWDGWDDSISLSPQKMRGQVDPGQAYQITLAFSDCNGEVADAVVVSAELDRSLDGVNQIYWLAE